MNSNKTVISKSFFFLRNFSYVFLPRNMILFLLNNFTTPKCNLKDKIIALVLFNLKIELLRLNQSSNIIEKLI